jgi:hypothetical protein
VGFPLSGPNQAPGVIVMSLSDEVEGRPDLDPRWERILVVFNGGPEDQTLFDPGFGRFDWHLHPALAAGGDAVAKRASVDRARAALTVPGLTAAVFVAE